MRLYATAVITTIQEPTPFVRALQARMSSDIPLIVVGDKKGPATFDLPNTKFLSLADQLNSNFTLAKLLPTGHYARKNLGYLAAFRSQPAAIFDTDDDNAPTPNWTPKQPRTKAHTLYHDGWVNVYRCFTSENIWPRGLPLRHARDAGPYHLDPLGPVYSPVHQLLCNNAPDVDAVWRLTVGAEPFTFDPTSANPIPLAPGAWCPFNSQATWWFEEAFPLMYLPSTCTFRMTDIWRSLIAQRCLWALGQGVTFHPPEVHQERNPHDLQKDFEDENPGYRQNESIAQFLKTLPLRPGKEAIVQNLTTCYTTLIAQDIFKPEEAPLLRAWLNDLATI
jgi:hypothetical protein